MTRMNWLARCAIERDPSEDMGRYIRYTRLNLGFIPNLALQDGSSTVARSACQIQDV
jgi:hypothetical protein